MYQFLMRNGQALAFGLGMFLTVIFLIIVFTSPDVATLDTMPKEEKYETTMFNFGLWASIILIVLTTAALVIFGIYHVASNPKGSLKGIIGFLALLLVFFIAYSLAPGEPESPQVAEAVRKFEESGNGEITAGNLKFISGGIITSLVVLGLAVLAFIVVGIRNFFK